MGDELEIGCLSREEDPRSYLGDEEQERNGRTAGDEGVAEDLCTVTVRLRV